MKSSVEQPIPRPISLPGSPSGFRNLFLDGRVPLRIEREQRLGPARNPVGPSGLHGRTNVPRSKVDKTLIHNSLDEPS